MTFSTVSDSLLTIIATMADIIAIAGQFINTLAQYRQHPRAAHKPTTTTPS